MDTQPQVRSFSVRELIAWMTLFGVFAGLSMALRWVGNTPHPDAETFALWTSAFGTGGCFYVISRCALIFFVSDRRHNFSLFWISCGVAMILCGINYVPPGGIFAQTKRGPTMAALGITLLLNWPVALMITSLKRRDLATAIGLIAIITIAVLAILPGLQAAR